MTTRRSFLQTTSALIAGSALPWRAARSGSLAALHPTADPALGAGDPVLRELALRAVDAARRAGATYADVRFTSDRIQVVSPNGMFAAVEERGTVYVAVRALVADSWGVASAPDCTAEEIVRIAREAVAQASVNRWSTTHPVQLDDYPPTVTGSWSTPMLRDPFDVSIEEKGDFLHSCVTSPELLGLRNVTVQTELKFRRQEKIFAATTGAYVTQTLTWVGPSDLIVTLVNPVTSERSQVTSPAVPLQSSGYEIVEELRPNDQLLGLVDTAYRQWFLAPIQIGRSTVVFDADTTAALVCAMIGQATEMDRVRGDEVNAAGASYLTEGSLGTPIADRMISITGSRSLPHGPATTGWDDEGIAPTPFALVADGMLVDFATSRSTTSSLERWYKQRGQSLRSHGCAVANSAADIPLVYPPDLILHPATHSTASGASFGDLISDAGQGVAVINGNCYLDREQRSGQVYGAMYEIKNGSIGRFLGPNAILGVRSNTLWRNVVALGGASSAKTRGFTSKKGEPEQEAHHGVVAVPMTVRDLVLLDAQRG